MTFGQTGTQDTPITDGSFGRFQPGAFKLFYAYAFPDEYETHRGLLKVGDATLHLDADQIGMSLDEYVGTLDREEPDDENSLFFTGPAVEAAALHRIGQQTNTAGLTPILKWAILAVRHPLSPGGGRDTSRLETFRDHDVHNALKRNGINYEHTNNVAREWFRVSLEDLKHVVRGVQTGAPISLHGRTEQGPISIDLRDEQKQAVDITLKKLTKATQKSPKRMLWNAIMRFGKTVTAYELVRRCNPVNKVLVITHRPDVEGGWFEDFDKILGFGAASDAGYVFSGPRRGTPWDEAKGSDKLVAFRSIQDIRGSFDSVKLDLGEAASASVTQEVQAEYDAELSEIAENTASATSLVKNDELFEAEWDLVIVDEGHEGTQTGLAQKTFGELKTARWLYLSGTPLNIVENFAGDVFTWDYVQERSAFEKAQKAAAGSGNCNPYASLPELRVFVYDIEKALPSGVDPATKAFNWSQFLRTHRDHNGDVVFNDPAAVVRWLNIITRTAPDDTDLQLFPFESYAMKKVFAHTFWLLPTVDSCVAMKALLKKHSYFGDFFVVNASGNNFVTSDQRTRTAVGAVKKAIAENERTITLSVGRLTTGVTIPEWTAVFMMSNISSPMLYLQTAFRCKSPGVLPDGSVKEAGYVFDFAPDRCLSMLQASAEGNAVARKNSVNPTTTDSEDDEDSSLESGDDTSGSDDDNEKARALHDLLTYMPIVGLEGARFQKLDAKILSRRIHRVFVLGTVDAGFETKELYDRTRLTKEVGPEVLEKWNRLSGIVGRGRSKSEQKVLDINVSGMSNRQTDLAKKPQNKVKPEESAEWKEARKAKQEETRKVRSLESILNAVSVRIPLLVAFGDLETDEFGNEKKVTVKSFPSVVDDASWEEFMPKGFLKAEKTVDEDGNPVEPTGSSWEFVSRFYDEEVFEGAVEEVRRRVRAWNDIADPIQRVVHVANLFGTFKNPDKETVLTPWAVVNQQYANTLGGLRFVDDAGRWYTRVDAEKADREGWLPLDPATLLSSASQSDGKDADALSNAEPENAPENGSRAASEVLVALSYIDISDHGLVPEPQWVNTGYDTLWEDEDSTFLDVNSKTALYPLYASASAYFAQRRNDSDVEWDDVLKNNVYANCRVPYSSSIARRVLWYDETKASHYSDDHISVVDIVPVVKVLNKLKASSEQKEKVWRWILNPRRMSHAAARAGKVLAVADRKSLDSLLDDISSTKGNLFSAVVGNPPYQMSVDNNRFSPAVYHHFADATQFVAERMSMIHPGRWTQGGLGEKMDEFRNEQLASTRYVKYVEVPDASRLFPMALIRGGICYYLWDRDKTEPSLEYVFDGASSVIEGMNILLRSRNPRYFWFVNSVSGIDTNTSMSSVVRPRSYYGNGIRRAEQVESWPVDEQGVMVYYPREKGRTNGLASRRISKDAASRDTGGYKVFVSSTASTDARKESQFRRPDRIFVANEDEITTDTCLTIGPFDTRDEAVNCCLYLKTDFASTLFGMRTCTQNAYAKTYNMIPLVDFKTGEIAHKPGTFLDFSAPETLDDQLASIYELTDDQRKLLGENRRLWKNKLDVEADR